MMRKYLVAAGVVLLVSGGIGAYDAHQRAIGAANQIIKDTKTERDSLRLVKDSLAYASRAQVETLKVAVIRRVLVRDTVERWLRDTVPVPVEVVREIVRADSLVIQACTVAFNTCEQEKVVLRRDVQLLGEQLAATRKLIPSGFQRARSTLTTAAIVAVAMYLLLGRAQ
jgi:hypothetical protein